MLSRRVTTAWAKSDRESDDWLSLVRHCEDAAAVAEFLWDDWLPASTRALLSSGGTEDEARILGRFLAGTHDVGKLSPAFAMQVDALCGPMRDAGLKFPASNAHRRDAPHSLVSFIALVDYLKRAGFDQKMARTYASIAGGHHGVPPNLSQVGPRAPRLVENFGDESRRSPRSAAQPESSRSARAATR